MDTPTGCVHVCPALSMMLVCPDSCPSGVHNAFGGPPLKSDNHWCHLHLAIRHNFIPNMLVCPAHVHLLFP